METKLQHPAPPLNLSNSFWWLYLLYTKVCYNIWGKKVFIALKVTDLGQVSVWFHQPQSKRECTIFLITVCVVTVHQIFHLCWVVWFTPRTHRVTWPLDFFFLIWGEKYSFLLYSKNRLALIVANILCWEHWRSLLGDWGRWGNGIRTLLSQWLKGRLTYVFFSSFQPIPVCYQRVNSSKTEAVTSLAWEKILKLERPPGDVLQKVLFPRWKSRDFFFP